MKPEIISVLPSGYGHWEVKVEQWYKHSKNVWTYTTNDSTLIDDYRYGERKQKTIKELIRRAKANGSKETIKL